MAQGDAAGAIASGVSNGSYMTIQPSSPTEWVIHHIYHPGSCEISHFDGTNEVVFDRPEGAGVYECNFHARSTAYFRVKNVSGQIGNFSWDGIIAKPV